MMNVTERDAMVQAWLDAKMNLDFYKALEAERRIQVANYVLEVPDIKQLVEARTAKLNLGNGHGVKATNVLNYTIDKLRAEDIVEECLNLGKSELCAKVIKWEPKLSETEYKKLDHADKLIFDAIITVKVGSPKVEFIYPKQKDEK